MGAGPVSKEAIETTKAAGSRSPGESGSFSLTRRKGEQLAYYHHQASHQEKQAGSALPISPPPSFPSPGLAQPGPGIDGRLKYTVCSANPDN